MLLLAHGLRMGHGAAAWRALLCFERSVGADGAYVRIFDHRASARSPVPAVACRLSLCNPAACLSTDGSRHREGARPSPASCMLPRAHRVTRRPSRVTSRRHSSALRRGSSAHAHADHCAPNIPYRAIAVSLRDTAGWKPIALCLGSDSPAVLLLYKTPPVVRITPSRVPCGRPLCRSPSCAPPQHHIAPAPTTPRHGAPIRSRVPCS